MGIKPAYVTNNVYFSNLEHAINTSYKHIEFINSEFV